MTSALTDAPRRALWRRILMPRFSLRTLLVLVTLFSLAAAWVGNWVLQSKAQYRTAQLLRQTNCARGYFEAISPGIAPRKRDDQWWIPDFVFDQLGPDYFLNIKTVEISSGFSYSLPNPEMQDIRLAIELLSRLKNLQTLHFRYTGGRNEINGSVYNVESAELFQTIGRLPELTKLVLCVPAKEAHYQPEHLLELKHCHKLRELHVAVESYPNVADISPIGDLTELEYLSMKHANDSCLSRLGKLTKLKHLRINTKLHTLDQLRTLSSLVNIRELSLEQNSPTTLEYYSVLSQQFPELRELHLLYEDNPHVLAPLKDHPSLKKLYLYYNDRMTDNKSEIAGELLKGIEIDLFIE